MREVILERRKKIDNLILNIRKCLEKDLDNKEYKREFFLFIEELKKIKPYSSKEYVKYNKFEENMLSCIFADYRMYHIQLLTKIKKCILKEDWKMVLEFVSELDRGCELLDNKIYYSIIEIL